MSINEIFYSLQGEGLHAGRPAVFVRFAGCNLQCPFCDTDHAPREQLSTDEIVARVQRYPSRRVVLTGGEPALFVTEALVAALHDAGFSVAIETNGTRALPPGIDWVTLSPKTAFVDGAPVVLQHCDELKLVYTDMLTFEISVSLLRDAGFPMPEYRFLQPCDAGDDEINAKVRAEAVGYCLAHPEWRLSLQQHKLLGIK